MFLVQAEMDTDFEDECKEIVSRRKKLTEELKQSSKASTSTAAVASTSTGTTLTTAADTPKRIVRKKRRYP